MSKVVLITGGTSGYGYATAKKFKKNGDTVIIASRTESKVKATVEALGLDGGFTMNVKNYEEWEALKDAVIKKYGRVDVLVNNAGGGVNIVDTVDQKREDIDQTILLNLNSVIYGSKLFGAVMKGQKDGIIINIASVCATHAWPGWSVYAAAKAGVLEFTKGLYVELRPFGAKATCIIPAAADTDFKKNANLPETPDAPCSLMAEDIANAVFFAANQPKGVVVEDMTVWGTAQDVNPL